MQTDTQLVISFGQDIENVKQRFLTGMKEIAIWMPLTRLQLSGGKTEILLFAKAQSLWTEDWWPAELGRTPLPSRTAGNLGILIDYQLTM